MKQNIITPALQNIRITEKSLCKKYFHLLTTIKLSHCLVMKISSNTKSVKKLCSI